MAIQYNDPDEQLMAEQAVLAFRAVKQAAKQAKHGHGLEAMENAIMIDGLAHLNQMLQHAAASHSEAQKKGSTAKPASVANDAASDDAPLKI